MSTTLSGAKLPFLCWLIIILLMLAANRASATRSKFMSMQQANNGKGGSVMSLLAKGHVPPSGPSHRGHSTPQQLAGLFKHRSP